MTKIWVTNQGKTVLAETLDTKDSLNKKINEILESGADGHFTVLGDDNRNTVYFPVSILRNSIIEIE